MINKDCSGLHIIDIAGLIYPYMERSNVYVHTRINHSYKHGKHRATHKAPAKHGIDPYQINCCIHVCMHLLHILI